MWIRIRDPESFWPWIRNLFDPECGIRYGKWDVSATLTICMCCTGCGRGIERVGRQRQPRGEDEGRRQWSSCSGKKSKSFLCVNCSHTTEEVLWIRDILVRILGSVRYLCRPDPDADQGGPKIYGSYGSVSGPLGKHHKVQVKKR